MPAQAQATATVRFTVVRTLLGRGRSGEVFLEPSAAPGQPARAVKVFVGDTLADAVHWIVSGAPNPYAWSEDAVRCALLRRRLLASLVNYWFDERLDVARGMGIEWNPDAAAWELHAEFAAGRHAALKHPLSPPGPDEARELRAEVLRPLQRHLRESGFIGLLWQAGYGNPVAASNFLRDANRPRWTWIDMESGVPALFAIDPRAQLSFYLPVSLRLGRLLFDDVDTDRLSDYLRRHESRIDERLGAGTTADLRAAAENLRHHQQRWHAQRRLDRGISAALAGGRLTAEQALYFRQRPIAWQRHEATRIAGRVATRARSALGSLYRRVRRMRPLRTARNAIALLASRRRRARLARFHLLAEVRAWRRRGQLSGDAGRALAREATGVDQAEYLADFGMHLALKPAYKTVAWLAVPILLEVGVIPLEVGAALLIFAGSIARTAYTGWRTASACARGLPGPWLALLIGTAPIVGSAAFPAQLLRDGRSGRRFAAWAVCALITRAGRAIPVWGGPDTLTEHAFNRVGLRVAGRGSGAALAQESSARQVRR